MKLRVPLAGEIAPTFTLPDTEGNLIELAKQPTQTVIVFMRHLA